MKILVFWVFALGALLVSADENGNSRGHGHHDDDGDSSDEGGSHRLFNPKSPCQVILDADINAPSAIYAVTTPTRRATPIQVYCEMGLGDGAYTFLQPASLSVLTDAQVQAMFVNKTSFLMRVRMTTGTQPYAVLRQLPAYSDIPLKLGLNENTGYATPVNTGPLGQNYLYFGFLPNATANNHTLQGLQTNGANLTFTNCDSNPNSYIAQFPNFRELTPSNYSLNVDYQFCTSLFGSTLPNPSARVMPDDFFMFTELHWGGCGCYSQTDSRLLKSGIISMAIGFR